MLKLKDQPEHFEVRGESQHDSYLTQCHNICSQEEKAVPHLKDKARGQAHIWEGEAEKLNVRHTTSRKTKVKTI